MNCVEYFIEAEKVLGPNRSCDAIDQMARVAGIHGRYDAVINRVSQKFKEQGNEKACKRVLIESIRSYQNEINGV
jgi:hypothetical protein